MRHLVGVGTYTARDDGVGLRVVEAVEAEGLSRDFRAIDLSGNVLDLLHYLDGGEVLIVDAARMGLPPGDYAFFAPGSVRNEKAVVGFSTHESDVLKVLALATSLDRLVPRVTILGIEPADTEPGLELSPTLQLRFREYVDAAVGFFAR